MRFPERYESGRPKVINSTGRKGSEGTQMRCYLGELGRPEQVLVTPAQRPKAFPASTKRGGRTGRSPAVTIAWPRPPRAIRNAVSSRTILADE